MKKGSTVFLRLAVFVLGVAVLCTALILMPKFAALVADLFPAQTYIADISAGILIATACPFLFAIHHTFRLLGCIDREEAFSNAAVKSLTRIKQSAIAVGLLYLVGTPFFYRIADADDAPGLFLAVIILVFASIAVSVFAAVLEMLLRDAIRIKTENDLTV